MASRPQSLLRIIVALSNAWVWRWKPKDGSICGAGGMYQVRFLSVSLHSVMHAQQAYCLDPRLWVVRLRE